MGGGYLTVGEVGVIRGALDLTLKTARHVLTPLDKVSCAEQMSECWWPCRLAEKQSRLE